MEKANIIKLFGIEISVSTNEKEVQHNSTPSEYSPTPMGDQGTLSLDYQEKRVLDHQNTNSVSVSAADPQNNHVLPRKSPAKKRAFDEINDFNYNIKGGNIHLLPFKKRFSATIFLAQVGDQNIFSSRLNMKDDPSYASSSTCDDGILDGSKVYCPMPLRCLPSELGFSTKKPCQEKKKAKKEKSIIPPVLPLEEIPGLMEIIGSQNGSTKPVFLYKKKLQESDVKPHLNRLFIPAGSCKTELMGFLSDEEKAAITSETRKGLEFVGMDKNGGFYNLRLAKWDSLRMNVINKEWTTMVKANNAVKGDWVELWGYRVNNNKLRLVVNFRKLEAGNADGSSSSSRG